MLQLYNRDSSHKEGGSPAHFTGFTTKTHGQQLLLVDNKTYNNNEQTTTTLCSYLTNIASATCCIDSSWQRYRVADIYV